MKLPGQPKLLGMTTLNEKGQIVIPKQARDALGMKAGDQLVMTLAPFINALVIVKPEELEQHLKLFARDIKKSLNDLGGKNDKAANK